MKEKVTARKEVEGVIEQRGKKKMFLKRGKSLRREENKQGRRKEGGEGGKEESETGK